MDEADALMAFRHFLIQFRLTHNTNEHLPHILITRGNSVWPYSPLGLLQVVTEKVEYYVLPSSCDLYSSTLNSIVGPPSLGPLFFPFSNDTIYFLWWCFSVFSRSYFLNLQLFTKDVSIRLTNISVPIIHFLQSPSQKGNRTLVVVLQIFCTGDWKKNHENLFNLLYSCR